MDSSSRPQIAFDDYSCTECVPTSLLALKPKQYNDYVQHFYIKLCTMSKFRADVKSRGYIASSAHFLKGTWAAVFFWYPWVP